MCSCNPDYIKTCNPTCDEIPSNYPANRQFKYFSNKAINQPCNSIDITIKENYQQPCYINCNEVQWYRGPGCCPSKNFTGTWYSIPDGKIKHG